MKVNMNFDFVEDANDSIKRVSLDGKFNYLDKNNNIICNQWYRCGRYFNEGFAPIQRNNVYWNFINKQGKELSEENYKDVDAFYNGFARVLKKNDKYNFIDYSGEELFTEDFNFAFNFDENNIAIIKCSDNKSYVLTKEGNICECCTKRVIRNVRKNKEKTIKLHYRYIGSLVDGYSVIQKLNDRYNYITINNEYLSTEDFDDAHTFCNGFAIVEKDGKKYYLNAKGFLCDYDTRKIIKYVGNNKEKATQELFNELLSKLYKEEELINNYCNTTNDIINDIIIKNEKLKKGLADKYKEIEELKEKYEVLHH